jgi:hypothetical protein
MHRSARTSLVVFLSARAPAGTVTTAKAFDHFAESEVLMGMPHSAATDSFCACCLAGTGRFVAARCIAFLRCK